jgi:hypothetical protein
MNVIHNKPLRYRIDSWFDLPKCLSNNSQHLHIAVSAVTYDRHLQGTKIEVVHDTLGVLFAVVVEASGSMLSKMTTDQYHEFTPDEILFELAKYGFNIEFVRYKHLSAEQLSYLITLKNLGFEKLRKLDVIDLGAKNCPTTTNLIVFNITNHERWLMNTYVASKGEFIQALNDGSALNITNVSDTSNFDWSWLTYVANIDDILEANANR